jgi:Family of unknown function (DUF6496)
MHRCKRCRARSGRSGKAGKVKSRKQAIAIARSKCTQEREESSPKEALKRAANATAAAAE